MVSIESFFSKASTFSRLFESSAEEVRKSALTLSEQLKSPRVEFNLESFSQLQQLNIRINEEIATLLCQSFITPLEREDLEALSQALYQIPKTIEKLSSRMILSRDYLPADIFDRQVKLLEQATNVVYEMVRQLWHQPHLKKIKEEHDRLHMLESETAKLVFEMLRDLYSGKYEPMQAIILRDLFEFLEMVIDRCCDAGKVIFHIVLKNS